MEERYYTVAEMLEAPFYTGEDMEGKLVRDHETGIEYEVIRLTSRVVRCAEAAGGSEINFNPKYFGRFKVLSPEMYAESR